MAKSKKGLLFFALGLGLSAAAVYLYKKGCLRVQVDVDYEDEDDCYPEFSREAFESCAEEQECCCTELTPAACECAETEEVCEESCAAPDVPAAEACPEEAMLTDGVTDAAVPVDAGE